MTTKKKTLPEDPAKAIRKLVDKIRKELSCSEEEAYFALRISLNPGPEKLAISHTKIILNTLNEFRENVGKGQNKSLFDAIDLCGELGFPLPSWVHECFGFAWDKYTFHFAPDLDGAFGLERPKKYHQRACQEKATNSIRIYWSCLKRRKEGAAIDAALFEEVAKEHRKHFVDLGASKVRDIYYHWERMLLDSHADLRLKKRRGRPPGKGKTEMAKPKR